MIETSRIAIPIAHDVSEQSVNELRALSILALRRMYDPNVGQFVFRLAKCGAETKAEGTSSRYTAIALLGLALEDEDTAQEVLHGETVYAVTTRLLGRLAHENNLGNVALTLWAARSIRHEGAAGAIERLRQLDPCRGNHPTVELAWALTSLSIEPGKTATDQKLAADVASRLLSAFDSRSGMFQHWPTGAAVSRLRSHIACFADLVYPIQALSHYYMWTGDAPALAAARCCGIRTCELQGPDGQWWWHFDVRTGAVVESYPVYAVHQDAMAPMALFALEEATGDNVWPAVEKGMRWLSFAPEIARSLIDRDAGLIWRKVARREPGKLSRALQAGASRLHRSVRVPGLNALFPPTSVDYECRPYHLGWLLYAWAKGRNKAAHTG